MLTIGILGLQGAVAEHMKQIQEAGLNAVVIKKAEQLKEIEGLIIPGGESTAIKKLMDQYGFMEPIKQFSEEKKPIFGTCAGMVLVAKKQSDSGDAHLNLMDISVKRNAFGRQRDSFEIPLDVKGFSEPFPAVFIRAPYAEKAGSDVEVLASLNDKIVAARQNHILVSAFHPELTNDGRFIELFIEMVRDANKKRVS
ncbi:pyridoxal phosphate synthase yaaE subunit [Bacillus sp. OV322]|uniref:pyridoxal 5'-phosphate synthase glutaminase subunit PdxT n=1 Tax=Bacillus sp. OV322 TaxID=1882764 RepID=UPI0008EE229B|nr:pyridoxal 5'-phosphate synthase glutaminase subunit PdxT [Bacillus sp. OV322]SFC02609.1 pyridoxal phosphate synthase yaaE subunit [Bacillus sp. OV322]